MKKIKLLIILIFISFSVTSQTVHIIFVSATNDASIGKGCQSNQDALMRIVDKLQKANIKVDLVKINGVQVNSNIISEKIASLQVSDKDAIWFYYSGHGLNSGKSIWPQLLISGRKTLYLNGIHKELKEKNARLVITVGDCCNIGSGFDANNMFVSAKAPPINKNLQKLFLSAKGSVIVSSSKPGQSSMYCENTGGYFTSAFTDIFTELSLETNINKVSWEVLMKKTKSLTERIANAFDHNQTPQYVEASKIKYTSIAYDSANNVEPYKKPEVYYMNIKVTKGQGFYQVARNLLKKYSRKTMTKNELKIATVHLAKEIARWNDLPYPSGLNLNQTLRIDMLYFDK